MARKISVEDLMNEGLTKAQAERVVTTLSKPKPRAVFYKFKATEEQVVDVAKAFPDLQFSPRYDPRPARAKAKGKKK